MQQWKSQEGFDLNHKLIIDVLSDFFLMILEDL